MRFPHHRFVPATALVAVFLAGCGGSGAAGPPPGDSRAPAGSGVAPAHRAVVPTAVGQGRRLSAETFRDTATTPGAWAWSGDACLTAGNASTPPGSVPACGGLAPQDRPGKGVLQLNPPSQYQVTFVAYTQPLSTRLGLRIRWNLYSFNGDGSDGSLL
jgi:hypothetical protein